MFLENQTKSKQNDLSGEITRKDFKMCTTYSNTMSMILAQKRTIK